MQGRIIGVAEGVNRSLDYGSYRGLAFRVYKGLGSQQARRPESYSAQRSQAPRLWA